MDTVRRPGVITLRVPVKDNEIWSNNPVTGLSVYANIRRCSDDKWWDFSADAWKSSYYTLKARFTDKGDGSYEYDWDQVAADDGNEEEYVISYYVVGGTYHKKTAHETLLIQKDSDDITFVFTALDGSDPVADMKIHVRLSAGGNDIYRQTSDSIGKASVSLPPGTYYVQAEKLGYTHAEESFTVSSSSVSKNLSVTEVTP